MANFLQQLDLKKFLKRAVVVTLLLACIEVVVFSLLYYKQNDNTLYSSLQESIVDKASDTLIQPNGDQLNNATEPIIANKVNDTIPKPDSNSNKSSTYSDSVVHIIRMDTAAYMVNTMKSLSTYNIKFILEKINNQKNKTGKFNNCIQIRKSSNCNISNAFKIATLLQSKGYIITGRLLLPSQYYGIKVTSQLGCLQLTIGKI